MYSDIQGMANQADCTGGEASVQNRMSNYGLAHVSHVPKNKMC